MQASKTFWAAAGLTMLLGACSPPAPVTQATPPTPLESKPKPACGAERDCKTSPVFESAERVDQIRLVAHAAKGVTYTRALCEDEPFIERWSDDKGWVKLIDERPPSSAGWRLYVGDEFISTGGNEGCDKRSCSRVEGQIDLGELAEYIKVGSRPAPRTNPGQSELADVFERRVVTGPVRGSLLVSRGGSCAAPERAFAVP